MAHLQALKNNYFTSTHEMARTAEMTEDEIKEIFAKLDNGKFTYQYRKSTNSFRDLARLQVME